MQSTSLAVDSTFESDKTKTVHRMKLVPKETAVDNQIVQEELVEESDNEAFEGFEEVTDEENEEEVHTGRKQVNWVGPRVPIFRFWPFLLTLLTLLGPITCAGIDKGPQLGVLLDSKAAIMRGVSAAPLEKACRDSFQAEQLIKSAVVIVGYFGWKPP